MMHVDENNRVTFRTSFEDEVLRQLSDIAGSLQAIAAALTGDPSPKTDSGDVGN